MAHCKSQRLHLAGRLVNDLKRILRTKRRKASGSYATADESIRQPNYQSYQNEIHHIRNPSLHRRWLPASSVYVLSSLIFNHQKYATHQLYVYQLQDQVFAFLLLQFIRLRILPSSRGSRRARFSQLGIFARHHLILT